MTIRVLLIVTAIAACICALPVDWCRTITIYAIAFLIWWLLYVGEFGYPGDDKLRLWDVRGQDR